MSSAALNRLAEIYLYEWNTDTNKKSAKETVQHEMEHLFLTGFSFDKVALGHYNAEELAEFGFRPWTRIGDKDLWTIPIYMLDFIPEGITVTSISGKTEPFVRADADDDNRFGLLSFGFLLDAEIFEEYRRTHKKQ